MPALFITDDVETQNCCNLIFLRYYERMHLTSADQDKVTDALSILHNGYHITHGLSDPYKALLYTAENIFSGSGKSVCFHIVPNLVDLTMFHRY